MRRPVTCLLGSADALHQAVEGGLAALDGQELPFRHLQVHTEEWRPLTRPAAWAVLLLDWVCAGAAMAPTLRLVGLAAGCSTAPWSCCLCSAEHWCCHELQTWLHLNDSHSSPPWQESCPMEGCSNCSSCRALVSGVSTAKPHCDPANSDPSIHQLHADCLSRTNGCRTGAPTAKALVTQAPSMHATPPVQIQR